MRIAAIVLLTALGSGCAAASRPANLEPTLVGSWCAGAPGTSYEEFELSVEGGERTFRSWLHERPESKDTWTLQGSELSIGNGPTYTVLKASPESITLEYPGGQPELYVRTNCFKVQVPQASR